MNVKSLLAAFCFTSFVCVPSVAGATPMEVLVTVPPQKDLVERIGGAAVSVTVMVPRGSDPHSYEPKPSQMVAASHARLWFTVGVPMEKSQSERIASVAPQLKLVPVDRLVKPLTIKKTEAFFEEKSPPSDPHHHEAKDHAHHAECHHHHESDGDPHSWLSLRNAVLEAQVIRDELSALDEMNRQLYEDNYQRFVKEANNLDEKLTALLKGAEGKVFLTFHPTWGHFARDYGLIQLAIEVEGKEPGEKTLIKIIEYARASGVRAIFAQPEFSTQSAEVVARALNVPVVMLDPLRPDWAQGLVEAAEALVKGVK